MKLYLFLFIGAFISLNINAMNVDEKFKNLSQPVQEVIGYYLHDIDKLDHAALQARANAIGKRMQGIVSHEQACSDTIALSDFIEGRLRFRLVEFFVKSDQSQLSALNKLALMREFVKVEQKEERQQSILQQMYELIIKDILKFESHHQALSLLNNVNAQMQESLRKKFYSLSEFKRMYQDYKIDIRKWSLEQFLYFFEVVSIFKQDRSACDFFNNLKNEVLQAKLHGTEVNFDQKKKDAIINMGHVGQTTESRLKAMGIPNNIPSEKLESLIILFGILDQDHQPKEKRKYDVDVIKKRGMVLLNEFKLSYSIGTEKQVNYIYKNSSPQVSEN